MASGHMNRTNRPNTWLHRPTCDVKKVLANSEPSTQRKANGAECPQLLAKADMPPSEGTRLLDLSGSQVDRTPAPQQAPDVILANRLCCRPLSGTAHAIRSTETARSHIAARRRGCACAASVPSEVRLIGPDKYAPEGLLMKCSKCGYENRAGAKFCEECAAPLARTCPHCGSQVSATAKFCPECAHVGFRAD
jgi:hypothetical protein